MAAFAKKNTTIRLDSGGEITLRPLTAGDTENFFEIVANRDISDKAFVQEVLFPHLVTPTLSKEQFKQIPDGDLIKIAMAYIESEEYTFKSYTDTGNIFSDFRKVITTSVEEEERRVRKILGPFISYAEQFSKTLENIYIPATNETLLAAIKTNGFSEMVKTLDRALDMVANGTFQPLQGLILIDENKKAIELLSAYWQDYYVLNENITASVFSMLAAQNLFPQNDFTKEIQEVSQLSIKNERIFAGHIKEITGYPEKQRYFIYGKAGIRFFSIDDFELVLQKIKKTVEIHSHLMFWRAKGELARNPERIAQGHMMGLLSMGLPSKLALGFQQPRSGSGIIDIVLVYANEFGEQQKIILELKVFGKGHQLNDGIEQLGQYMQNENTDHGYRVIFNATKGKLEEQQRFTGSGKVIKDIIININLHNPSSLDKKNETTKQK